MKRHLSITILLTMLMSMVGAKAFAYDVAAVNDDGVVIYYYLSWNSNQQAYELSVTSYDKLGSTNKYAGYVAIPESAVYQGKACPVTSIGDMAFLSCSDLFAVDIPNTVKSIGNAAFQYCDGLTSVSIPSSVTSIGYSAFDNCRNMTSVTINSGVKSINGSAFRYCISLTSVTIPSSVTSIGGAAFSFCTGLTSIDVETGNTKYDSRNNCNAIIETSSNTLIAGCKNTVIPDGVASIGVDAFYGCSGLTSAIIPSSVTSIGDRAFLNCSNLKTIVSEITEPFEIGEIAATSVVLIVPAGTRTAYRSTAGWSSFTNILEVGEGGAVGNTFEKDGIFYTIGENNTASVTSAKTDLSGALVIPSEVELNGKKYDVTSIKGWAFYSSSGVTSVTIPSSVISIGNGVFLYSSGLKKIVSEITEPFEIGDIGTTSVILVVPDGTKAAYQSTAGWSSFTNIYEASDVIVGNTYLINDVSYTIGENNTASVTSSNKDISGAVVIPSQLDLKGEKYDVTSIGDGAFIYCSGLTSVNIPTSVTKIGEIAFYGCTGLSSVTIPNSVISIGTQAFSYCSGLTSIVVETGNANYDSRDNCNAIINTSSNTLMAGCKNTVIPNSVTSLGRGAFLYCSGLTSVTIPNSVTSIGMEAFSSCSNLTSVTIGNSVKSIGYYAFYGCSGLTSVTIPNSVTSISNGAFQYCSGLKTIVSEITEPFEIGNIGTTSVILIVPDGTKAAYQSTAGWSSFKSIFEVSEGIVGGTIENNGIYYTIGENYTASVTSANKGISSAVILGQVDVNGEKYDVTSISYDAFLECVSLRSVTIPNSVTYIGDGAFQHCRNLTSINIPNSVTYIDRYAFYYCSSLKYLAFGTQLKKIDQEAFSCCPAIVEITSKATTPPSCGDAVFLSVNKKNCKLFVPKGCADAYKAAWQWQDLNIQEDEGGPLGDADNDGIVDNNDIDEIASYIMSRDTNNIRFLNADMNGDNEVNVADLVLLINLCSFNAIETPLTFEAVSGTVTVSVNNYYCSFAPTIQYRVDDGEWTNLTLSHNDCHGSPFYANAIPAGKIVQIRSTGWYTCISAQNDGLDISCDADCYVYGNISSVNSLDYVTIISGTPSFVFYKNTHIKTLPEKALFLGNNCGSNAFFGCTGLTSITIPQNVTSIGDKAFGNCTKLTNVTCLAESVPSTNASAFDGSSIGSATLHVPQSALSDYQNTAPWSGFGKIVAIGGKE